MIREPQTDWTHKKLDELGFVGRGKSKHRPRNDPSLYGGKYPFIRTGEVKSAGLYISGYTQTYNEKGLAQSKLWDAGTLLITIAANIAETGILKIKACFPDSIVGFISDPTESDVRFVKYSIDAMKLRMQSISRGTTQDNLSLDKLLSFNFHNPGVKTQRKIAAILSAYDGLIENNTRRIKILEEMAQALYREWFVHFRFPGHEKVKMVASPLGPIPGGWEAKPVGEVVETLGGSTPSTKNPEYWEDGDVIWFTPSDLTSAGSMFISNSSKRITKLGLERSSARMFPPYSVMMTSRATIGVIAINTKEACTNQGFITCIPNELLSAYQIYFWIDQNREQITNIASGATYKEINRTEFRELQILVADPGTSTQFVELVGPICKQIENLAAKNVNLRRTRDLLLPKLVSGEIDVSNLDIR